MHAVVRELIHRGVAMDELDALEVFAGTGSFHTMSYASKVRSLTAWEIDPTCEPALKKNLPVALVKITDSFVEVKRTSSTFNLIVVDNPMSTFGEYCEHFDLFPDIYRLARRPAILMIDVIPEVPPSGRKRYPYLFSERHLTRRRDFYQSEHPEKISLGEMALTYSNRARANGYNVCWHFFIKRTFVYYLIMQIE